MPDTVEHPLTLIVVVPAFNEEQRIVETIEALRESLSAALPELVSRIYVVDDGSQDTTRELADRSGADKVIQHRVNLGLGAAVRSGMEAARRDGADIVVKFDADRQHDPMDIPALIAPILADEADVVYGNRFERIEYRMSPVRRMGNFVFTRLMRWLTGWPLKDSQPGIFAVDRHYLDRFSIPGDYNYTQQLLLDAYHKGMRFSQVPVAFRKRETGDSFVSFKYPFKVLSQIFWLLVAVRPMKVFGTLGGLFMLVALGMFSWDYVRYLGGNSPKPVEHANAVLGAGLFGLQTFFFGVLAQLIVRRDGRL